ncbi:nucleoside phosphorylase [Mycoplasmatota bacterium zrk1]
MDNKKQMHIALSEEDSAKYAFVPGNPDRCVRIAKFLDNHKLLAQHREYTTYEGYLDGEKVLVVSTGIGGPSAAICMEELKKIGVDTFIRIGTCASTSTLVEKGDVVIPNGVVRMEGTGSHYLPMEFPAVPTYELVKHLESGAKSLGYDPKIGVNITKDSFYTQTEPETKPIGYDLINRWNSYLMGGAQSTSMESATLFLVAASLNVRVATVLVSATDVGTTNRNSGYPIDVEKRAIEVGIEGMRNIIKADKEN